MTSNQDGIQETAVIEEVLRLYPNESRQVVEFKTSLTKLTQNFTTPLTILPLSNLDSILASFVLVKTFTSLNCPFDLHLAPFQLEPRQISQYLKKRSEAGLEVNPVVLIGYPFHLTAYKDLIDSWARDASDLIHVIDIETDEDLRFQKIGVNVHLPWTITSLAAVLSIFILGQIKWWHFLAVLLSARAEQLDVSISSNYSGITEWFMKKALEKDLLRSTPDINLPNTTSMSILDSLALIFTPMFTSEENIEKFLLRHDIEARDKHTTSLRPITDLTTSEKTRLISGLIEETGLRPESLIRKVLLLNLDDGMTLNVTELNSLLLEMLTNPEITPTDVLKLLLALPQEPNFDQIRRKNGFNLETSLHDMIKILREVPYRELPTRKTYWFQVERELPLILKIEAAGFVCRQLHGNIIVSSPTQSNSTPRAWNHVCYLHLEENMTLSTKEREKSLDELTKLFVGFQLLPRMWHRVITFQTSHELTMEQLEIIIHSLEEEGALTNGH